MKNLFAPVSWMSAAACSIAVHCCVFAIAFSIARNDNSSRASLETAPLALSLAESDDAEIPGASASQPETTPPPPRAEASTPPPPPEPAIVETEKDPGLPASPPPPEPPPPEKPPETPEEVPPQPEPLEAPAETPQDASADQKPAEDARDVPQLAPEEPVQAENPPAGASGEAAEPPPSAAARQARVEPQIRARPKKPIKPFYPRTCRERGEEGNVTLEFEIDARGVVSSVLVMESCGFPDLENAAKAAVKKARFEPAKRDGRSVPDKARITLEFKLDR